MAISVKSHKQPQKDTQNVEKGEYVTNENTRQILRKRLNEREVTDLSDKEEKVIVTKMLPGRKRSG